MARRGFSLVELMVVVAIIGILAMIAIPAWTDMQNKARRAELPTNVAGIKAAQLAYEASNDTFVSTSVQPRSLVGDGTDRQLFPWPSPNPADWGELDWRPDGDVRGSYSTWQVATAGAADFCVLGHEDVAGDGTFGDYYASASENVSFVNVPAACGSSSAT